MKTNTCDVMGCKSKDPGPCVCATCYSERQQERDAARVEADRLRELVRECVSDWIKDPGHRDARCHTSYPRCVCGMEHLLQRIEAELGEGDGRGRAG